MTTALVLFVVVLVVVLLLGITLGMLVAGPLDRFTNAVRTPPKPASDEARPNQPVIDAPEGATPPADKETAP